MPCFSGVSTVGVNLKDFFNALANNTHTVKKKKNTHTHANAVHSHAVWPHALLVLV